MISGSLPIGTNLSNQLIKKANEDGMTVKKLSKDFGRHEGSIRARLERLLGGEWQKNKEDK